MAEVQRPARLSGGQRIAVGVSVALGLGLAAYGVAGSYQTVSGLAERRNVPLAPLVPVGIDGGLIGVVVLDLVLSWIGPADRLAASVRPHPDGGHGRCERRSWMAGRGGRRLHVAAPLMLLAMVEAGRVEYVEAAATHSSIREDPIYVPVSVGFAAHGRCGQVQITEPVGGGIEVASENRDLRNREETGWVRVVAACPLDDLREMARGNRTSSLVVSPPAARRVSSGEELDGRPGRAVTSDRNQISNRDAMFVTLNPGSVPAAVGVDEPLAEGRDNGHAPARMTIGKQLRGGKSENRRSFIAMIGFFTVRPTIVGEAGVGASPVIRYRH